MTQRTKAGLQANLNTDLADNTSGDISAADVRNNLIDFTDSVPFLSSSINTLSGSFSGSFQGDGSGLTGISGGSTDTGSLLTTASVSLNTIIFTKGDASTFNITVDTGSAPTTADTASVVQITADNANASRYVLFSATNTEAESPLADTSLRYNPSTNTLSTELQGNASTATTASHALTALTASYASTAPASDPFPYTGSAGITGSLDVVGDFTVDKSGDSYLNTGSILVSNLELLGNASALMRGRANTEIRGESFYDANPALPGNVTIENSLGFGSTKGYTKIDAGDLYMSGSTINSTGSWTHEGPTVLSGSLEVSGSVTIGRLNGAGHDLGVYSINTASFQIDYLDMEVYSDTTIDAYSFGSTVSNFEIKNTAQFGGTKGYIKLNAGDLLITGSAVYIDPNSLPTTEPSDSGQLWLSGSAGNSKYLMVRD